MGLGKPQSFLAFKREGGFSAKKHIGMEVKEVAKSECWVVMTQIRQYLIRKGADLQQANSI